MNLTTLIRDNTGLRQCALCRVESELRAENPGKLEELQTVMKGAKFSYKLISVALEGEGYSISPSIVRKHVKGECAGAVRYR